MAGLKQIEVRLSGITDLALISSADDSIWLVVPLRWWDLSTLLWWVFMPSDRKASATLTMTDGTKVSVKIVRVATRHVRTRGFA